MGLIAFSCFGQQVLDAKKAKSTLKTFYAEYGREFARIPSRDMAIDSLMLVYCSPRLLSEVKRRKEEGLDYDLFLQAQDWDSKWTETIRIDQGLEKSDIFIVSFYVWCANMQKCWRSIHMRVILYNGQYKIDEIFEEPLKEK